VTDPLDRPARLQKPPQGQGESILVVEDEEAVRIMARRALEDAGYRVLEAESGDQGLELVESAHSNVALVLCDVILPEMSGHELGRQLAATRPQLPVLYMSGYPGLDVVERGLVAREAPFIEKPFTPESLALAVRRLLDQND
jgi:two-component system cell cycle sensor histidine kinase/response regulator CckA